MLSCSAGVDSTVSRQLRVGIAIVRPPCRPSPRCLQQLCPQKWFFSYLQLSVPSPPTSRASGNNVGGHLGIIVYSRRWPYLVGSTQVNGCMVSNGGGRFLQRPFQNLLLPINYQTRVRTLSVGGTGVFLPRVLQTSPSTSPPPLELRMKQGTSNLLELETTHSNM